MDDISFKDIRVLPNQLELKSGTGRTLSDLVPQLQSGAVLKGLVVGATPKGEIIFHTGLGRFISPNPMGLQRGDTITIRLARQGEVLSGKIVKVNNSNPDIKEPINLAFVREPKGRNVGSQVTGSTNVELGASGKLPNIVSGKITYLNMSKIDSGTALFKALSSAVKPDATNIPIELKLVTNKSSLPSTLTISGQVASEVGTGKQLIKTDFGIITTENTNLASGQKVDFSVLSINNVAVRDTGKEALAEFIFKMNQSWSSLKKLSASNIVGTRQQLQAKQASSQNVNIHGKLGRFGTNNFQTGQFSSVSSRTATLHTPEGSLERAAIMLSEGKGVETGAKIQISQPPKLSSEVTAKSQASSPNIESKSQIKVDGTIPEKVLVGEIMGPKLGRELTDLGIIMSSIRKGTRKLKGATEIEASSKSKLEFSGREAEQSDTAVSKGRSKSTGMNIILKSFSDMEAVKKVAYELSQTKEVFSMHTIPKDEQNIWYNFHIPLHYTEEAYEQEISISNPKKDFVRFVLNSEFENIGEFQLDGIVQFEAGTRNAKNFDLIVRLKNRIDQDLSRSLSEIFLANQKITGVRGNLQFENNIEFLELPEN